MDELAVRRRRLFRGANFSSALFFNGDKADGASASFTYFSGCDIDGCYLLLKKNGGTLFTHEMNLKMARSVSRYPVKLLGKEGAKLLGKEAGTGRVGADLNELSAARYSALRKKAKLKFADMGRRVLEVRGSKSPSEVAAIAASAKIARRILDGLDPWKCRTEKALAERLKVMALEAGCEVSFEPIVATGRNSSFPHHSPSGKKLGTAVLVDFGVKHRGYCSDFTRCYFRKKAAKERRSYEKCRAAFREILSGLPKCRTGKDVALMAEKVMKRKGLPRLIHAIGHGIGLEVHEYPGLHRNSSDRLEGCVLAIEPASYFKDFGVRFEGMVANTKAGWRKI